MAVERWRARGPRLLCALAALLLSGCLLNTGDLSLLPFRGPQPLAEEVIYGKDNDGPKLALIEVQGVISEDSTEDPLVQPPTNMIARIREALEIARKDDEVRGILLRIYSPGGTVTASESIYHEISQFKKKTSRPVVAYMQGLAASGGYYVAMASDEIVVHPAAVTGSIGVVMAGINLAGLMQRFGVADQTLTTGPYKDSGSPFRAMRSDERAYLEGVLADLFSGFREVVSRGRPGLSEAQIKALSDGRIFTARQAKEVGLVDSIGHFEDAVAALEARAAVSDTRVVIYQRPQAYRDNFYSRARGEPLRVDVDWLGLGRFVPPAGFYYIWPPALAEIARH